jgi:hypothetical protein
MTDLMTQVWDDIADGAPPGTTHMLDLYRPICARYRPETIRRHESRLVGAIYARLEALRMLEYLRAISAREGGTR